MPGSVRASAATVLVATLVSAAVPAPGHAGPPRAASSPDTTPSTRVGGGAYLYRYLPLELAGVESKTEIYAVYVNVEHRDGPWTIRFQGRWRDTRLRPFFPSTAWIQEAWAGYRVGPKIPGEAVGEAGPGADRSGPTLELRAGKLYRRLGRFWDGSFIGNLHYFDGLKLDPDFGVEGVLRARVSGGTLRVHGQWTADTDRVSGALAGRDLEGREGTAELGGSAAGLHYERTVGRVAGRPLRLAAGVSGLLERGRADAGTGAPASTDLRPGMEEFRLAHAAVNVEVSLETLEAYLEWTRRTPDGVVPESVSRTVAGSAARYWLAGISAALGPLDLRYNYSRARYDDAGFTERIHQPGVSLELGTGVSVLLEYNGWLRDPSGPGTGADPGPPAAGRRLDRSLNAVLWLRV